MSERWTTEEHYVFEGTVIDVGVFRDGEHMGECSASFAEWLIPRLNAAQALVDAAREACRAHANYTKTCVAPLAGPTPGIASILLDRALAALSSALEPFRENKDGQ